MFRKREDGLGHLFLPFTIPAVVLAILCTIWSGVRGWWIIPMVIGSWLGWSLALAALFVLGLFVLSFTIKVKGDELPKRDYPRKRRVVIFVMGCLSQIGRVRIHLEGTEQLPESRFYLISNHRSNFDPIVTSWALRKWDLTFIMKPEVLRMPIVGPWVYTSYYLPIDRDDPRKALVTIQNAAELLKKDEVSLGVYPEGTRSKEKDMLPFHNGVFKVAERAGVPIVVLAVKGTDEITKRMPWRRTDVYMKVCKVISAEEAKKSRSNQLSAQVRAILEEALA